MLTFSLSHCLRSPVPVPIPAPRSLSPPRPLVTDTHPHHRYGYSAVSFNFIISALTVQWAMLVSGFWDHAWYSGLGLAFNFNFTRIPRRHTAPQIVPSKL